MDDKSLTIKTGAPGTPEAQDDTTNQTERNRTVNMALRVLIIILGIAIAVLSAVFLFRMVGGALGNGANEAVKTLEDAMNGDFESYWSLFPDDYIRSQAAKEGQIAYDYKAEIKKDFKKHAAAVKKAHRTFELETSHEKTLSKKELEDLNEKLIKDHGITVECTEAVSVTLSVRWTKDMREGIDDHDNFIIGKIDGEWYPLDFEFIDLGE